MTKCSNCKQSVSPLAVFPGGICLACYEVTPEANAPLTEAGLQALARAWGAK
jgi:hypothetical protein